MNNYAIVIYNVFQDQLLKVASINTWLIAKRPKTIDFLLEVEGIGLKKATDYGNETLEIINQ